MLFVNCTTIITIQQIRPRILNSIEKARRTISPSRDASTTSKTPCSSRFHLSSGPKAFDYSHLICAQWSAFQILISGIIFGTETNLDLRYRRWVGSSLCEDLHCFPSAVIQEKQESLETAATYGSSVGSWARNRVTAAEPLATFGCCVLATGWEELANLQTQIV